MLSGIDGSTFKRYQSSLIVTIILVLVLLYMTMGAQFESFILPLLFMITIPLSLAGTGPALALSQSQLDSGAVLGIIVLLGIVVNNGIVLYESSEKKMYDGLSPADAVCEGAAERLKPALATTLTTVIVLIPLIISQGSTQKSMSAAMIGGCVASTILTLFVLPPLFAFFLATKRNKA
jgi:HAE1 family hydrophobic/amphiphilic exporter-1